MQTLTFLQGIQFLLETGFIQDRRPDSIARFLHETEGLSKAMIGEYLGEGSVLHRVSHKLLGYMNWTLRTGYRNEENLSIMHAFVDMLDFSESSFVDSLRLFLQSFRLPGAAQKIDRYMLKFAARYMAGTPEEVFANAGGFKDTMIVGSKTENYMQTRSTFSHIPP